MNIFRKTRGHPNDLYHASLLATKKLMLALENNQLEDFLVGMPVYQMDEQDEYGNHISYARLVMEAIYRIYNAHPEKGLDKETFECLERILRNDKSSESLFYTLSNIEHHIKAEKSGKAPFHMDCEKLLDALQENLEENKELYETGSYTQIDFVRIINEKVKTIEDLIDEKR